MDIKVDFDDEQLVWFKNGKGSLFATLEAWKAGEVINELA